MDLLNGVIFDVRKRLAAAVLAGVMMMTGLSGTAMAAKMVSVSETTYEQLLHKRYDTTLGGMHGRRLYVYGIVDGTMDGFSEESLALDKPLSWAQLCVMLARLIPTVDTEGIVVPDSIPVWAKEAYQQVADKGWITSNDVTQVLSGAMLGEVLTRVLNGTSVLDVQAAAHEDGISRGDAFRLISGALNMEVAGMGVTLQEQMNRDVGREYRDEFTVPYVMTIHTVNEEDAWKQIYECLDYNADEIRVYHIGPGDDTYVASIVDAIDANREGAAADDEYDGEYLFWEYFNWYGLGCWAEYYPEEKYARIWTPDRYDDVANVRVDALDWMQYYETDEMQDAYNAYVKDTLEPLRSLSDYEKVVAVNKLVCNRCRYNYAALRDSSTGPQIANAHSLFGFFYNGAIVCDGYSDITKLLLTELGVKCIEVIGEGNKEGHAWNKICVDGQWYNADICWNDTGGNMTQYLLKSDEYMLSHDHTFDEGEWESTFYDAPDNYKRR